MQQSLRGRYGPTDGRTDRTSHGDGQAHQKSDSTSFSPYLENHLLWSPHSHGRNRKPPQAAVKINKFRRA